jgi:hypothetical protein
MTKNLKFALIGLGAITIGLASYFLFAGGNDRLLKFIPNNAAFVVRIDVKGLYELGKKDNLFDLKMLKDGMKNGEKSGGMGKIISAIMEKPEECGIDFRKPAYVFGEMMSRGKATAMLMEMHSESKFTEFINKKRNSDTKVEKTEDFQHLEMGAGEYLSWGNGILVYSVNKTESTGYPVNILKRSRPGMEGNLNMKEMLANNGMLSFMVRPGEILKWNEDNIDLPIKDFWNPAMMSNAMSYIGKMDFVNGGINMTAKAFSAEGKKSEMPEVLKKENTALKLAKFSKREMQPAMLMVCNFNMNGLLKYIAEHMDGGAKNEFMENEMVKLLKSDLNGELLFCLPAQSNEDSESTRNLSFQVVAGTNGGNTALESKLQEKGIEKSEGLYRLPFIFGNLPLSFGDKHIVVGESGTSPIKTSSIDESYLKMPMFMMIDVEKLVNSIPNVGTEGKALKKSGMVWLFGQTNETMQSELKFRDKDKNGLSSLLEMIDQTMKEDEERRARFEKEFEDMNSSTQTVEDGEI